MVMVVQNGHGDTSSNLGRGRLNVTFTVGKGVNLIIPPPAMGK